MCSSGSKTQTSTSSTKALPEYQQAYSSLLGQAQQVATQPWNPATQQAVADFSSPQNQAFGAVQNNLGAYQPDLANARQYAAAGASPISASQIQNYMNPYQQSVIDATQNQFANSNAQQLQSANANAAKIGALTGDRSQVASSVLQGQQALAQNPVIAGLYSQGYTQALGAAQNDANRALQGAQINSSLAGQSQQLGLNDINSLWGAGQAQQAQQQNVLNANTSNAQAQAQYPFATTQWLSSLATNLGGAAGSTGTQTTPGPNLFSQLAGLGLAGASLYKGLAAGGRVGYDSGGTVTGNGLPYSNAPSYVPSSGMPHGGINHQGSMPSIGDNTQGGMSDVLSNFKQAHSAFQGLGNLGSKAFNWANTTTDPASGWSTTTTPTGMSGFGNYLGNMFGFSEGGMVRPHFADGGDVTDLFDDGTGTYAMNAGAGLFPFARSDATSAPARDPWAATVSPAPDLPEPSHLGAPAASVPQQQPAATAAPMATPYALPTTPGLFGIPLSDAARQGLLTAGLGMMASKSPWVGTAIGEGGLAGAKSYQESKQQAVQDTQNKSRIDQEAQRLAQAAKQAAEQLKLGYAQLGSEAPLRAAQVANYALTNQQTRAGMNALSSPDVLKPYIGTPYEAVARAAAAKGDVDALSNINKEMAQFGLLPMGAGIPAANSGTEGDKIPLDDYLKGIPDPLVRGQTGAVLRGETTLNALTSRSPGIAQQVNRLVYNYDDTFDPQSAVRRNEWRTQLQKGPLQVQRQAIGTMFDHLNTAAEKAQALNPGSMPAWDAAKNLWSYQTGDDRANNLAIALNNYATEYAKLISGKAPAEGEIEQTRSMLHNAMSGKQLAGGLATLQELAMGRVHELESQGDTILGKYKTANDNVLSPNAQKAIDRANSNRWLHPNAGPPAEAVQLLRQNPDAVHKASFDKHFGVGAADQILGAQ